jgi:hypothetical protein
VHAALPLQEQIRERGAALAEPLPDDDPCIFIATHAPEVSTVALATIANLRRELRLMLESAIGRANDARGFLPDLSHRIGSSRTAQLHRAKAATSAWAT